jgi:capsule polysaccharide modification protein KpsS
VDEFIWQELEATRVRYLHHPVFLTHQHHQRRRHHHTTTTTTTALLYSLSQCQRKKYEKSSSCFDSAVNKLNALRAQQQKLPSSKQPDPSRVAEVPPSAAACCAFF